MDDIEIDGVVRDLSHLGPIIVAVKGAGEAGADLRVEVVFGSHAVSVSCDEADRNMKDENGKPRLFDEDRYAFSLGLPEIARRMLEQNYFCWESSDRNRVLNYAVVDVAPGRITTMKDGEHYAVFFYLMPSLSQDSDVVLNITTCYRKEIRFKNLRKYNMKVVLKRCLFTQKRVP